MCNQGLRKRNYTLEKARIMAVQLSNIERCNTVVIEIYEGQYSFCIEGSTSHKVVETIIYENN